MTKDDKKKLTKWMEERWHEEIEACKCSCGRNFGDSLLLDYHIEDLNRTYDSDADMLALFRKLAEKGLWIDFIDYIWWKVFPIDNSNRSFHECMSWLFLEDPERSCNLVAEFKPWEKFQ